MNKRPIPKCFVQQAMVAIDGKWRVLTLRALARGSCGFGALKRAMPSITERMLALVLRDLQLDGLIERTVESAKPLRVTYTFTPLGRTLIPLVEELYKWGTSHGADFIAARSMNSAADSA